MEFLNGGDLMYHIQDKGRFELYRATYVRALCEERSNALYPSFLPQERLESGQGWHWGHLGHCVGSKVLSLGLGQSSRMDSALYRPWCVAPDYNSNAFEPMHTPN